MRDILIRIGGDGYLLHLHGTEKDLVKVLSEQCLNSVAVQRIVVVTVKMLLQRDPEIKKFLEDEKEK